MRHFTILAWLFTYCIAEEQNASLFMVGTGIHDMTGPAAQVNFMGYAVNSQNGHGIHMRLRSRAFIISSDNDHGDTNSHRMKHKFHWRGMFSSKNLSTDSTICLVSMDAGMGSDVLVQRVLDRYSKIIAPQIPLCVIENTSLSGTHTHSAPGGFLQYTLYQMTSRGFVAETMDTFVESVAQSLAKAQRNLRPATISLAQDLLWKANINRSPTSYMLNPEHERSFHRAQGDTDKNMVLLKFTSNYTDLGMVNWFAVHGTSMNSTNLLISGDNKGYASYEFERAMNPISLPGQGHFVAAFASTNLGDVSPNTAGPKCMDTGLPCDGESSTCNGRNELCVAFGPGKDMMESTQIIGRMQYEHALKLYNSATPLYGSNLIDYRHSFVEMANLTIVREDNTTVHTCPAALGYSFAAGTTDGPGQFDFKQHTNTSNPFWNAVSHFLSKPSQEQVDCHAPKPILLNTGEITLPYPWDPATVPISLFRIGQDFFIANVPCEFTTMAGRRLRLAIQQVALEQANITNATVVIAGLANSYTHYVTTFEEYQAQRYEAASTLYGPHTLEGYLQEFRRLSTDLLTGQPSKTDQPPADLTDHQMSFLPPVIVDTVPPFKQFGQVHLDVNLTTSYVAGTDTVVVEFHSANPRNNQRIEGTYLTVEHQIDDAWPTMFVDGDWCTKFIWRDSESWLGISYARIEWVIPSKVQPGNYRICHFGTRKHLLVKTSLFQYLSEWGAIERIVLKLVSALDTRLTMARYLWKELQRNRYQDFQGCSSTFKVVAPPVYL